MPRKEIVPHIELGRVYALDEFRAEWAAFLGYNFHTFDLPTEIVVRKAQVVAPDQGRAYTTPYYVHNGRLLNGDQLAVNRPQGWDHLLMVEVWADHGDDGHVHYCLQGFRFIPYEAFRLRDEYKPEMPAAALMHHFDYDRLRAHLRDEDR